MEKNILVLPCTSISCGNRSKNIYFSDNLVHDGHNIKIKVPNDSTLFSEPIKIGEKFIITITKYTPTGGNSDD